MDEEYYIKEIAKLICILQQDPENKGPDVMRSYVKEKLERIINGIGIEIHPSLKGYVEDYINNKVKK